MPNSEPGVRDEPMCQEISNEATLIFSNLIKSTAFGASRRPRVLAMLILKKFALHYDNSDILDLDKSPLAQWCLGSLKSSIRELRIAAGYDLPLKHSCMLTNL